MGTRRSRIVNTRDNFHSYSSNAFTSSIVALSVHDHEHAMIKHIAEHMHVPVYQDEGYKDGADGATECHAPVNGGIPWRERRRLLLSKSVTNQSGSSTPERPPSSSISSTGIQQSTQRVEQPAISTPPHPIVELLRKRGDRHRRERVTSCFTSSTTD